MRSLLIDSQSVRLGDHEGIDVHSRRLARLSSPGLSSVARCPEGEQASIIVTVDGEPVPSSRGRSPVAARSPWRGCARSETSSGSPRRCGFGCKDCTRPPDLRQTVIDDSNQSPIAHNGNKLGLSRAARFSLTPSRWVDAPSPPVSSIQQLRFVADYPGRHQVPRNSLVPLPSKCRPWTEVDTRLELARDFSSRSRTLISRLLHPD